MALASVIAPEVDAGTDIVLTVKVACPHGCDLRERLIHVMTAGGIVVAASPLAAWADGINETAEFAFRVPDEVGEHSWAVVFPKGEADGVAHEAGSHPVTIRTVPHDTSLAVWEVPSPVVMEHPFRIRVGATCSSGCDLTGKEIQILDENGTSVARGKLAETPLEGTRGLYWTEVELVAPARHGAISWSVAFAPSELRLPHGRASWRFGFETVRPPQYSVMIKVVDKDARTPVVDAQVRLGVYFAYSDPVGLARIATPRGTYSLDVLKTGYEAPSTVLEVNDNVTVQVEVAAIPPESPDAYWLFDPTKRL